MRKQIYLLWLFLFVNWVYTQAQDLQIKGKVTSEEDGTELPGATITAKGTQLATVAGFDGTYTINIPPDVTSIVVSYLGYETKEIQIAGQTTIDVTLKADVIGMEEVVVTAFGIERSTKAIGFAATTVSSDELNQARSSSAMNSLQGKVAGVNITQASGAPGSSTKVIVRGFTSITGNNQPLYVVDGIPINNTVNNQYYNNNDVDRTQDFGNRANDINPDDIESLTILKGAAAALYGSRAANGVVLITTKKGKKADRLKVEYNGSTTISEPLRLPQMQNIYGQGWSGTFKYEENGSWGPKYDGKMRLWGNPNANQQKLKPFVALEDNLRDFFDRGVGYNNSVAVSGGKDNANFYLSYGNVREDGIVPTDNDSYNRNSLNFNGSISSSKLTIGAGVQYINKKQKVITQGQGSGDGGATLYQDIMQIPRDISILELKDYNDRFNNINNYFTPYAENPWFIINENGNDWNEDRFVASFNSEYRIAEWLKVQWRVGSDIANSQLHDWGAIARTDEDSINNLRGRNDVVGRVNNKTNFDYQLNSDLILATNYKFDALSLNALLGYNLNERKSNELLAYVTDLVVPNFYDLSNSSKPPVANPPRTSPYKSQRRLTGFYSQVELGYNDFLYLTLAGRYDKSSTLPEDNNSYFYPSASFSFLLSDAVPAIKPILPFAKVRASYSTTGNDAPVYRINQIYSQSVIRASFADMQFPLGGINAFELSSRLGNSDLKPEITTETEFGIDFRFLENRLGVDLAIYNRKTVDQIMLVSKASSSGFLTQTANVGTLGNKGVELLLTLVPVKIENFAWNIGLTYSRNRSNISDLPLSLKDGFLINNAYEIDYLAKEGKPIGIIEGPDYKYTPDGRVIVNDAGIPIAGPDKIEYGSTEADYRIGIKNEFEVFDFTIGGNMDIRQGGLMYTYTSQINAFVGNSTQTTFNDRQPFLVPNSVTEVFDNKGNVVGYEENTTPIDMEHVVDYFNRNTNRPLYRGSVVDRSFVKLRNIYINYNLPKSIVSRMGLSNMSLGLVGNNLLLWTPADNNYIDPESSTWGGDLESEFGEFAVGPSIRSFSVSLKITY